MILHHRMVLHVPEKRLVDGKLEDVTIGQGSVKFALAAHLLDAGIDSYYTQEVEGRYKGRKYPEIIATVFTDDPEAVAEIFTRFFAKYNRDLQQERYAYEKDNELRIITT